MRYEYYTAAFTAEQLRDGLNTKAKDGWRLVQVVAERVASPKNPGSTLQFLCIFESEVQNAAGF
jgi:hypothetical protein